MPPGRVVLLVSDETVALAVRRAAARAGVAVDVDGGSSIAVRWATAAGVIVDRVGAEHVAALRLPRRDDVAIATAADPPEDAVWRLGVAIGAAAVFSTAEHEQDLGAWLARRGVATGAARVVAVAGARGGAGASVLAAAVGLSAALRRPAVLVDTDGGGGGLDYLLGIEAVAGARWADLDRSGVGDPADLLPRLPRVDGLAVLSCGADAADVPPAAVRSVVTAASRANDVVVDFSRAAVTPTAGAIAASVFVLVVPAEVRAVAAAAASVTRLRDQADVRLVLRHPAPGDLRPADVSAVVGAPVLSVWRWDRRLAAMVEGGRFAHAWRRTTVASAAAAVVSALDRADAT